MLTDEGEYEYYSKCLVFIYIVNVKPLVPAKANQGSININYEIARIFSARPSQQTVLFCYQQFWQTYNEKRVRTLLSDGAVILKMYM